MKRMLFNATQQEELRVAIVDGQKLIDIDIETTGREQRKSNIYKGVITRIEPSLEACFVNYGEERHGFLPFKEVARTYFRDGIDVRNASIKDALREGQEIMVQVEKEERGNKGAALTSFVSLAGRYLVLMPNNPRGGGVSRRVEGEDRQELRETMDKLDLPSGMSVIARTAGIGRNVDELQWDLNYLMQLWRAIEGAGQSAPGAFLIYQESSLVIRAIRDYFQPDIGEILIDTDDIYEQAQQFMSHVMPDMVHRVKRYRDDVPLFSRFQIEHQIETAYSRTVPLPSGGAIVIDHTEALVSVDVNSARATRGSDIETTAFHTNLEAADEVARQLRLRDLGGLIVIDFIDMENAKNQREVETRLKDALHYDRARVQMGKISRFGLMELSRQRLRPSLSDGSHVTCPRCNGTGHIRDTESSALQVLRIIQEEAMKENSAAIHVQAPVDVAAFLLNEKRGEILKIETRHRVSIILIPNKHLETPHYKLERIKHDDPRLEDAQASYAMTEQADTDISYGQRQKEEVKPRQEAMVKGITPDQPAPIVERRPVAPVPEIQPRSEEGFLSKLFGLFRKKPVAPAPVPVAEKPQQSRERTERNPRNQRNRSRNRGKDRQDDRESNRSDVREGAQKPTQSEPAVAQATRQPRPPREAREPKEGRETREGNESRRERTSERQPRPAREDRKENVVAKSEIEALQVPQGSPVANAGGLPHPSAAPVAEVMPAEAVTDSANGPEAGEGNEEQRRRRRRRGGRNRNRRDRDSNGAIESDSDTDVIEGNVEAMEGEAVVSNAVATRVEITATQTPLAATEIPVVVAQVTGFSEAASAVPRQYSPAQPEHGQFTAVSQAPEALEAETRKGETGNVDVDTHVDVSVSAIPESVPEAAVRAEPEQSELAGATEPAAPAIDITGAAAPKPPQIQETSGKSMRLEDFQEMLSAAGLTLAVTNPEKLKAAQEAAANVTVAPRPTRERKPAVPPSNEPLIQVETHR
ncbi:Rne/Rng family ribonuclease [Oxalobacteraceae bacterium R-40]|uniref:Ribonuclease E n=1 Tax=Keguizhuia sedimenti TaxID=3064264 RepID=A0ABU1BNT1_9BURK|nr:Rne/Rng family ribonuclease [Oxalobacteraceae bacterium R-40]